MLDTCCGENQATEVANVDAHLAVDDDCMNAFKRFKNIQFEVRGAALEANQWAMLLGKDICLSLRAAGKFKFHQILFDFREFQGTGKS